MDNVWIVITHCSNTSLKGFDELKEELGKSYTLKILLISLQERKGLF